MSPETLLDVPTINSEASALAEAMTDTLSEQLASPSSKHWLRRLAIGTACVVAADIAVTNAVYYRPRTPTGFIPLNPELEDFAHKQPMLIVPGYTQRAAAEIAPPDLLDNTIGAKRALMGLAYNPRIHNVAHTAQGFDRHFKKDDRPFDLLGVSMGTPFALAALAHLVKEGVDVPHIETLAIHSSPYSLESVREFQQRSVRAINMAYRLGIGKYPGGMLLFKGPFRLGNALKTRQVVNRETNEIFDSATIGRAALNGLYLSAIGASPQLCINQAGMFFETKLEHALDVLFEKGIINNDSQAFYLRAEEAGSDKIIDVDTGGEGYKAKLRPQVGQFKELRRGRWHVDPAALIPLAEHMTA